MIDKLFRDRERERDYKKVKEKSERNVKLELFAIHV